MNSVNFWVPIMSLRPIMQWRILPSYKSEKCRMFPGFNSPRAGNFSVNCRSLIVVRPEMRAPLFGFFQCSFKGK